MKTINPKVSIVIPVYNGSNYLKESIDSALAQTYENIEVIVVNDGSDDGGATEEIAKSYGDKIRYYFKENGGVASALNFGIKEMKGSYFSWLSHDDLYEKTKIEDQVNFAETFQSDSIIVACNARVLFPSGVLKKEPIDKKTFDYFDIFLATSAAVGVNGCALLIPKKALVDNSGFDVRLPVTQDYDLWFRLKNSYKFVLLEKNLVISRRHNQQDSVQKQTICLEAGDRLHYSFLNDIDYERFEKYFSNNKSNIKHTWKNYSLYKIRGYKKTASKILKNILRYYYKNNTDKFYKVFNSEIGTIIKAKLIGTQDGKELKLLKQNSELTDIDYQEVILECNKLMDVATEDYLAKKPLVIDGKSNTGTKISNSIRRFGTSIKQDGMYLTIEKIIRKIYAKVIKK